MREGEERGNLIREEEYSCSGTLKQGRNCADVQHVQEVLFGEKPQPFIRHPFAPKGTRQGWNEGGWGVGRGRGRQSRGSALRGLQDHGKTRDRLKRLWNTLRSSIVTAMVLPRSVKGGITANKNV